VSLVATPPLIATFVVAGGAVGAAALALSARASSEPSVSRT